MPSLQPERLSLRIPISDGPDGRVGYLYFHETDDGAWRLSRKERDEHDAKTGTDRQAGVDALADTLEAFGNERIRTYQQMRSILANTPEARPGFRGNYRQKLLSAENVKFHESLKAIIHACAQVGERLRLFDWPIPYARCLTDGSTLTF